MSQPLLAVTRISVFYTIQSFRHVWRGYVSQDPAAFTPRHILKRDGVTSISWVVAAQAAWDTIRQVIRSTETPVPSARLENLVVGTNQWQLTDVANLINAGASADATVKASQLTVVVRDTAFKFLRFVVLESTPGYVGHAENGLGIDAHIDVVVNNLNGTNIAANEPFTWQMSRGFRYINPSGSIAGATLDLNDKLKRRRGFE